MSVFCKDPDKLRKRGMKIQVQGLYFEFTLRWVLKAIINTDEKKI